MIVKGSDILGRIEKSIEIKAPPEKVWEMLALDRHKEWDEEMQKGLKSLEYTSEVHSPKDKYRVGASAHANIKGVRMREFDLEITESLENEKMTIRSYNFPMVNYLIITYALKPVEEGTRLTNVVDYEMSWGILGKFLDKLYAQRTIKKEVGTELEKLKSILEK